MTRPWAAAFLTVALFGTSACHRAAKPDPQAALDDAFKAGLLTKDEYNAKRAEIAAAAASAAATAAPKTPAPTATNTAPAAPAPAAETAPAPAPAPPQTAPPQVASNAKPAAPAPRAAPKAAEPDDAVEDKTQPAEKEEPQEAAEADVKEPAPAPLKGCEDEDFKSGGQKSDSRFFAASPEAVRRAAVAALESMDFNIRKNTGKEIEANKKRHIGVIVGAGGERVTLTFQKSERNGQSGTRVTGETRKNFVGRLAQRTWTDAVLAQMACKLREGR